VRVERSEIEETGEYSLEGLFIRLSLAIDSIGATRVVLDTIESLFGGLANAAILRAELRRLFRWLKDKGVTAIITGERGDRAGLTRNGLEEYVSDCVILLDNRVNDQISTRRLRIVKYRGSRHGTNEYPYLIDDDGISVLPITSLGLRHEVSSERISSGVDRLDTMLGGGYYRGSSVLVSGTAGSGKTSLAVHFADAACRRGERVLYFAFEESEGQLTRNMQSIGIDVTPWLQGRTLRFEAARPTFYGMEMHLTAMHKIIQEFQPQAVIVDPLSNFAVVGTTAEAQSMIVRLIDFLKSMQITAMFTNLASAGQNTEQTEMGISSLMDTWLLLRDIECGGERNRAMYILKSRGMSHSNQVREFLLTDEGIELRDAYLGPEGVLTGSARLAQEAKEERSETLRRQEADVRQRQLERRRQAMEAKIAAIRLEYQADEEELRREIADHQADDARMVNDRHKMAQSRKADLDEVNNPLPPSHL
jgi:circadian clock protein KaiC